MSSTKGLTMLEFVRQGTALSEIDPLSHAIAERQLSDGVVALQTHYSRKRSWFTDLSDDLLDDGSLHVPGFLGLTGVLTSGLMATFNPVLLTSGVWITIVSACGAVAGSYGAMVISKIRTWKQDKRALEAANDEAWSLTEDLAQWLRGDYGLSLTDSNLYYLAKKLLGIQGYRLDPTHTWTFQTASGAAFEARIVQREDGGLELHRPTVAELREESLIQPLRKGVEL